MKSDEELKRIAQTRAEERVGFYRLLSAYVLVNAVLVLIWWFSGAGYPWPLIIILLWGIGVVAYGFRVFTTGTGMTDRMAQQEYERLKQRKE